MNGLEAHAFRPRPFLAQPLLLVGLVFLVVAGVEEPLAVALAGQDVGADAVQEPPVVACLLYTSDAADEGSSVDLGGRRIIKKKKI